MTRWLLPLSLLTLAACSSAPKKPAAGGSSPVRVGTATAASPSVGIDPGCKTYAPAQEDLSKRGNYTAGGLYAPGVSDTTPDYVPNVDCIPEPVVVALPRSAVGNRSPYAVLNKQYHVLDRIEDYVEQGTASYYGAKFHGRRTSNLEVYDMYAFSAAHKSLPLPSFARVTNLDNGKSVVVRVNDRGPFHDGRVVDLSYAAAVKLDIVRKGTGRVEVRALVPGEDVPQLAAAPAPVRTTVATGVPARIESGASSAMDSLVGKLPAGAVVAAAASGTETQGQGAQPWRYHMRPDAGKTPSADEFDTWMQSRGVRVATGRPQPALAATSPVPTRGSQPVLSAAPATVAAAPAVPASTAADVQLQVGSFASRENADRALARLTQAGIGATLSNIDSNGRTLWRLRALAPDLASVSQLAARIAGLGFGQPQVVRE
ncbi:MAG TPA: septal ring lytic transglycosylase RlpA family protein [Pseudoxanthomonas sp.]|nr:septal ring lytic transglycosylase RlpA family protein [Pseudoxanthomonas sp.]